MRKLWNQRESVLQQTQDIPDSSVASVFCRIQAWFPEESNEEEEKDDETANMDPFGGIEDLFTDILSLGPKIHHSDFKKQSMRLHQEICGAYENLL